MPDLPDIARTEIVIVELTNAFRRGEKLGEVKLNAELTAAARLFAQYLAKSGRFAHEADGRKPAERYCLRISRMGYQRPDWIQSELDWLRAAPQSTP